MRMPADSATTTPWISGGCSNRRVTPGTPRPIGPQGVRPATQPCSCTDTSAPQAAADFVGLPRTAPGADPRTDRPRRPEPHPHLRQEGRCRGESLWPACDPRHPGVTQPQDHASLRPGFRELATVTTLFACRAGDGNRTRTVSLGKVTMPA